MADQMQLNKSHHDAAKKQKEIQKRYSEFHTKLQWMYSVYILIGTDRSPLWALKIQSDENPVLTGSF